STRAAEESPPSSRSAARRSCARARPAACGTRRPKGTTPRARGRRACGSVASSQEREERRGTQSSQGERQEQGGLPQPGGECAGAASRDRIGERVGAHEGVYDGAPRDEGDQPENSEQGTTARERVRRGTDRAAKPEMHRPFEEAADAARSRQRNRGRRERKDDSQRRRAQRHFARKLAE